MERYDWLTPAIILGAAGLALQGAKAAWDLWVSIRQRKLQLSALRLQWLVAFMQVIDSSPGAEGERVAMKGALMEKHLPEDLRNELATIQHD